jgi:hypothetical protein
MDWLTRAGADVSVPLFTHPDYDLIADFGGRLLRVQVKTSTYRRLRRWVVQLATRGGNQSWSGTVKRLDQSRCDSVFIHVGDGRRWYLPAGALGGCSAICLGGPKYSEYEIEPAMPLQTRVGCTAPPQTQR